MDQIGVIRSLTIKEMWLIENFIQNKKYHKDKN